MKNLKRIMLIDDDTNANFYNKYILNELNSSLDIIEISCGKDALEYLKKNSDPIDIILLDINMPLMNGWRFLEEYDKFDASKKSHTIIFMLTSSINPDDKKRVLNYPYVKQFFNKPLDFETLEKMLDIFRHSIDSENLSTSETIDFDHVNHLVMASYVGVLDKDKEVKFIADAAEFSKTHKSHYILFDMTDVIENYGFYDLYEMNKNLISLTGLTIQHHCAFVFKSDDSNTKSRLEFKESVAKNWGQDIFKNFTNKEEAIKWLIERRDTNQGLLNFMF